MLPRPRAPSPGLLVLAAMLAAGSCRKSSNVPAIEGVRPAGESRAGLLAVVTVAPVETISGRVDALSRILGLPFTGKDLLATVTAQYQLSLDVLSRLDGTRPIAIAYVAPPTRDRPALEALAASGRSPEATEQLIAALGPAAAADRGVRRVQRPGGGTLFVATRGTTLLVSSSREGLAAAGALAVEAMRPPAHDLEVSVHPEALARWRGTDVRSALAAFRKEIFDDQIAAAQRRGAAVFGRAERVAWEAAVQALLDPLADTTTDGLTLDLDPRRGIRFGVRLQPRAGTPFARRVATATPYAVDPALLAAPAGEPLVSVWAGGASPFWPELYATVLDAQARAGIKGAGEVARRFAVLHPLLTGAFSAVLRGGGGGLTTGAVISLRPGAPASGALDALGGLVGSTELVTLLGEIYGRQAPAVRSSRAGDTLRTELAFPIRDRPGDVGSTLAAIFGSATLSTLATVSRERLVAAMGPDAQRELARLAAGTPAAPRAELAAALAESQGQDGFFYLDLWAAMRPAVAAAKDRQAASTMAMLSAMPGFAHLELPVLTTYRGGEALTGELRVPLATLERAAAAVRPLLGLGAGSPGGR
jgi:hypothetical protein